MKTFRFRLAGTARLLMTLFWAAGCAAGTFTAIDPPAGAMPGTWTFRHAVTLDLPGAGITLPFTGIMRFDAAAGEARALALSGMGMTLLDMTVNGESHTVRFLHPSLARLPHAAENAAAVIRCLWLGKAAAGAGGPVVSSGGVSNGWAREITFPGEGFTVRLVLLESRRET